LFRYEASWALEEDYGEVIQRAWDGTQGSTNSWDNLEARLGGCKKILAQWQMEKKDPMGKINFLKKKLISLKATAGMMMGGEEKKNRKRTPNFIGPRRC
jgi:hypothetical protein